MSAAEGYLRFGRAAIAAADAASSTSRVFGELVEAAEPEEVPAVEIHRCTGPHWYAYRGQVGSSSPTCTRVMCDAPNPHYRPNDDPYRRADS